MDRGKIDGGGFGFYIDYASGIHAYRNIAYNNAHIGYSMYGYWRNGEVKYYDNIAANSVYGFHMSAHTNESDTLDVPAIDAQVKNNIIVNSEVDGVYIGDKHGTFENVDFDHNLYWGNGWRREGGGSFPGDEAALTALYAEPDGPGWRWQTWHLYPDRDGGTVVHTESRWRP